MKIIECSFFEWYIFAIEINWLVLVALIAAIYLLVLLWRKLKGFLGKKSIQVDEMTLGIGSTTITLKYNKKCKEIAYKIWVELSTRKIGLRFDPEYDVISEVYDSWYQFFGVVRNLLKEIPPEQTNESRQLIELTNKVLNLGLRPHLTKWQAKFRTWLKENDIENMYPPQEHQREFPNYKELENDLIETNNQLIEYMGYMESMAFN